LVNQLVNQLVNTRTRLNNSNAVLVQLVNTQTRLQAQMNADFVRVAFLRANEIAQNALHVPINQG
jgi:hypothetical protein